MRKKIFYSLLACCAFLLANNAHAFTCRTSDGGVISPGGSTTPVNVRVRIGPDLQLGKNEIVNVSQVTCTNDVASWTDYLKTDASALSLNTALFGGIGFGATINGTDYTAPVPGGISIMTLTNKASQTVVLRVYIVLNKAPTRDIKISQGDIIGQINFVQTNDRAGCPQCGPYRWQLIADNDAYFVTTSCTINNNQQINVDFNQIRQDYLTQTIADAQIKQDKALTYQCEDLTATQDVQIRLVSDAAPFSSNYIKTTNANVGVALVYNNQVISPNNTFSTRVTNGVGNDTVTFVPVKNNVAYSDIATGPFTGSATLIFSAP